MHTQQGNAKDGAQRLSFFFFFFFFFLQRLHNCKMWSCSTVPASANAAIARRLSYRGGIHLMGRQEALAYTSHAQDGRDRSTCVLDALSSWGGPRMNEGTEPCSLGSMQRPGSSFSWPFWACVSSCINALARARRRARNCSGQRRLVVLFFLVLLASCHAALACNGGASSPLQWLVFFFFLFFPFFFLWRLVCWWLLCHKGKKDKNKKRKEGQLQVIAGE
ncbi:hypothetical protein BD289DRAFT_162036 [Coniella lustricola]|uniref:Uncharacterized protein n=1 Tax=Coniella lustricola TaxID=2025994 RepID=A0A2T2ZUA8_9PEZI|nr:hypothetical protein BD289DRAFT_162036 [Coniella lustricola]